MRSAIISSQYTFPRKRITVNLAPADLPKRGSHYDLAIAIGILVASGQIQATQLEDYEFYGELGPTGAIKPLGRIRTFYMLVIKMPNALLYRMKTTATSAIK